MTEPVIHPMAILAIGIVTIVGLIIFLRVHAFLALILSALLVSFLAPGEIADKVSRVAVAFGKTAEGVGIIIALAAVIGACMMQSGAADRIVQSFLKLLGEKRSSIAPMGSGYVLSVPVFFDTVFYLLVPLARSLYRTTGKNYLLYLVAIGSGAAVTHSLVPPTPGPLLVAGTLGIDVGMMIIFGLIVGLPAASVGLCYGFLINKWMPVPLREGSATPSSEEPPAPTNLPPLSLALLPVALPVLLISLNTVVDTLTKSDPAAGWQSVGKYTSIVGNSNMALLISTLAALYVYWRQRGPTLNQITATVEHALMSGGVIILITCAGGAFGKMLKEAGIGGAVESAFKEGDRGGLTYLFIAFGVTMLLKIAQGSATVAMITGSGLMAGLLAGTTLPFHMVYIGLAIGAGSKVTSWMNDSGFWIFAKMGGLTEGETLKSWTVVMTLMGFTAMAVTVLLSQVLPMSP